MHTNRLIHEKSPYLLQHAHNPVDWQAWGPEAFAEARRADKPIFLSIGYSTCHWCHVMERESFENDEIAGVLNRDFVPIKVDREERPDVDSIYMNFVQATTGSGGWPMSVWLTPDLKPFIGGTYFPPDDRYGRAGFKRMLERIAEAWHTDREQIVESSVSVLEQLRKQTEAAGYTPGLHPDALESGFYGFRRSFDTRRGGFGEAPKFPRPSVHNFLLRYWARTRNQEALDMVLLTLREMAKGGMHDQLGGGFHRYSVDGRWFVPHFEKMLYDQAQLAISYLEAFQITHEELYAQVARSTLDYVLRDMRDPAGGFYSAEDADSVIDSARPDVKGEGAFYIWAQSEIESVLGAPAAAWFCDRYGVEAGGNVRDDPHGEFAGRNILYQAHTLEETAQHFGKPLEEVQAALGEARSRLLEARARRVRPLRDDKVLTAWNGLMISAFARAGAVLQDARYIDAARAAVEFVISRMHDAAGGVLHRRYRQGEAAIPAFLDDYAFFIQSLLDLYEADFDLGRLEFALRLAEKQSELFEDREHGAFYSSADDASLVLRLKEDYDGAEPAGNSIAVLNLLRLAQMTGRQDFRDSAEHALRALAPRMMAMPAAVPQLLAAYEFLLSNPRQVILAGGRGAPDTRALLAALESRFVPNRIVLLVDGEEARRKLSAFLPVVESMRPLEGKATAYVCENYACKLPVSDPEKLVELLQ